MFHDFYEDDQRAADAAARAEAVNYERNNRFDWDNETAGWEDEMVAAEDAAFEAAEFLE